MCFLQNGLSSKCEIANVDDDDDDQNRDTNADEFVCISKHKIGAPK